MRGWYKSTRGLASLAGLLGIAIFVVFVSQPSTSPTRGSYTEGGSKKSLQDKLQQQPASNLQTKKIESKEVSETQTIPFQSTTQNDSSIPKGSSRIAVKGVDGAKTITYKVIYVDGVETAREKISESITAQSIAQVTKVGTSNTPNPTPPAGPAGASALCKDGSLSYSSKKEFACYRHGGIAIWYR